VTTLEKLTTLQETYADNGTLGRVVDKLVETALNQHRQRLQRYQADLQAFEQRFGFDSVTFYQRFQAGQLGDEMDLFEWASLYELELDLLAKIRKLELVQ